MYAKIASLRPGSITPALVTSSGVGMQYIVSHPCLRQKGELLPAKGHVNVIPNKPSHILVVSLTKRNFRISKQMLMFIATDMPTKIVELKKEEQADEYSVINWATTEANELTMNHSRVMTTGIGTNVSKFLRYLTITNNHSLRC